MTEKRTCKERAVQAYWSVVGIAGALILSLQPVLADDIWSRFSTIMNIAQAGDHIVCASALYGGTYNLYAHTIKKMGVEATFVDPDCTEEELEAAFQENTRAVFTSAPAMPTTDQ